MMQAASHNEDVFETGTYPPSSQAQMQKTRSCHTHHNHHNHHHHQLLKSSENTIPTAPSSIPTVTPQTAFSSLPHTLENEGHEQDFLASRKSKCSTIGGLTTSASENPSSPRLSASLSQRNGYGSSKSTSSPVLQPVIVRTYTPTERSKSVTHLSSPPPLAPTPALFSSTSLLNFKSTLASIRGRVSAPSSTVQSSLAPPSLSTQQKSQYYRQEQLLSSPAAAAVRSAMEESSRLPPVDAFTFKNILRAVEPEIQPALDAIAEICSRSKLSLADEYSAHLPPQGEISASRHSTNPYRTGIGNGTGTATIIAVGQDSTLPVVPEASSSSERLAGQQEYGSEPLTNHGLRMKRRSTGKQATAECGTAKPNNDKLTSPNATTEPLDRNDKTTSGATDLPKLTQSVVSPMEEANERSKRRSSITLLSSSTSEGTGPTASTTTAVAKEITSSRNAATNSRFPIASSNNAYTHNKPAKYNLTSWVFWGSSDHRSDPQNRIGSFERNAETKLNDILRGTEVTMKHSVSTKK